MPRFGAFEAVPAKRLLLRDGVPLALTPKAFDTLLFLLEHRDRVVSKEELLSTLWSDAVVEEATLSQHIYKIRKALNDEDGVRYIATVPRRGYRFVAKVVDDIDRASSES
jgi:DNA-binding winged helix-turn-helix (wHTH) protein